MTDGRNQMIKLEVGKRYVSRSGEITGPLVKSTYEYTKRDYPFLDLVTNRTYALDGSYCFTLAGNEEDLVKEYEERATEVTFNTGTGYESNSLPKKTLNFWEAREAALAGKKVRKSAKDDGLTYSTDDFSVECECYFSTGEMALDWEIVEEPKLRTYYFNVYENTIGGPKSSVGIANAVAANPSSPDRKGCIEITVDENGKLVDAKNL
jgi:hypothetical protein